MILFSSFWPLPLPSFRLLLPLRLYGLLRRFILNYSFPHPSQPVSYQEIYDEGGKCRAYPGTHGGGAHRDVPHPCGHQLRWIDVCHTKGRRVEELAHCCERRVEPNHVFEEERWVSESARMVWVKEGCKWEGIKEGSVYEWRNEGVNLLEREV